MEGDSMELVHEFDYQAQLAQPALVVGEGPFGLRIIMSVADGWAKGERISGKVAGAGADWALVGSDGWARVDVRGQIVTDDGAVLYLTYTGVMEVNEAVQGALAGGETSFDDQYFRTTPRIETGDERYAWVNQTQFVARGRFIPDGVEYAVYRLT
jgi:hypothetical protein